MASACAFSASNLAGGRRSQGSARSTEENRGVPRTSAGGGSNAEGRCWGCFAPLLELVLCDHLVGVVLPLRIELAHGERLRARVGDAGLELAFRDVMQKLAQ